MRSRRLTEFFDAIDSAGDILRREQENYVHDSTPHRILWRVRYELGVLANKVAQHAIEGPGLDFEGDGANQYGTNMTFKEIERLSKIEVADRSGKEVEF